MSRNVSEAAKGTAEIAQNITSVAQAAEKLGITRNAIDQRLHNGHRKLAEKLGA